MGVFSSLVVCLILCGTIDAGIETAKFHGVHHLIKRQAEVDGSDTARQTPRRHFLGPNGQPYYEYQPPVSSSRGSASRRQAKSQVVIGGGATSGRQATSNVRVGGRSSASSPPISAYSPSVSSGSVSRSRTYKYPFGRERLHYVQEQGNETQGSIESRSRSSTQDTVPGQQRQSSVYRSSNQRSAENSTQLSSNQQPSYDAGDSQEQELRRRQEEMRRRREEERRRQEEERRRLREERRKQDEERRRQYYERHQRVNQQQSQATEVSQESRQNVTRSQRPVLEDSHRQQQPSQTALIQQQAAGYNASNQQRVAGYDASSQQQAAGYNASNQQRSAGYDTSNQQRVAGYDTSNQQRVAGYDTSNQQRVAGYDTSNQQRSAGYDTSNQQRVAGYNDSSSQQRAAGYDASSQQQAAGYNATSQRRAAGYDASNQQRAAGYDASSQQRPVSSDSSNQQPASRTTMSHHYGQQTSINEQSGSSRSSEQPIGSSARQDQQALQGTLPADPQQGSGANIYTQTQREGHSQGHYQQPGQADPRSQTSQRVNYPGYRSSSEHVGQGQVQEHPEPGASFGSSYVYDQLDSASACPETGIDLRINGLDCQQAVLQYGAYLCYTHEYTSKQCCEVCAQRKQPSRTGCEYGDHAELCSTITASDCYDLRNLHSCCETCQRFRRNNMPAGCEYGDMSIRCENVRQNPGLCYVPDNQRLCCETCSQIRSTANPGCPWGDYNSNLCQLFDENTSNVRINCYSQQRRKLCCQTCERLRQWMPNDVPADCQYGDRPVIFTTNQFGRLNCSNLFSYFTIDECRTNQAVSVNCCHTCHRLLNSRG